MDNKELDLSKPFVKVYKEGKNTVLEMNTPNNEIGDFAFEYDFDGSDRESWHKHLKELEAAGTLGDLTYKKATFEYNELLDGNSDLIKKMPLTSYSFLILDLYEVQ